VGGGEACIGSAEDEDGFWGGFVGFGGHCVFGCLRWRRGKIGRWNRAKLDITVLLLV
jgi:hypothetical protein